MSKCDKFNIKISSTHKELADGAKKKKKECLSSKINIKTNHFDNGPDYIITTSVKVCFKVISRLLKTTKQGDKMFHNF